MRIVNILSGLAVLFTTLAFARLLHHHFLHAGEAAQRRAQVSHALVPISLSAVSEAPTSEHLSFRCAVKGRFRYSDLKEAARGTMGFVSG